MRRNSDLEALADEHRAWLSPFDSRYLANWEKLYVANAEAALTEAGIRRLLHRHCVTVEPNEKLTGSCGGPDFRCTVGGRHFYVEATCITIKTAERKSGIKYGRRGFSSFSGTGLIEAVFAECQNKAPQCACLDAPALVAVGTFHSTAAMIGFKKAVVSWTLTGTTMMEWDVDIHTGRQGETYQSTQLRAAAFLRPDNAHGIGSARSSISGVLMCAVGLGSMRTLGALHPQPVRVFDPAILQDIDFGRVDVDHTSMQLRVHWPAPTSHGPLIGEAC